MNKFTIEYLITISANIYFWLYIVTFIFVFLYSFTEEYKHIRKVMIGLGKYPLGITLNNFITMFLFILSNYYK